MLGIPIFHHLCSYKKTFGKYLNNGVYAEVFIFHIIQELEIRLAVKYFSRLVSN